MGDSDLNNLLSSQDLNFIRENLDVGDMLDGDMGILEAPPDIPEYYNQVPENEDYPGNYDFEFYIDPKPRKSWIYSSVLNKVFIISNSNFPIDFKWKSPNEKLEFFLRAMPLYSTSSEMATPVKRCIQHGQESDATNAGLTSLERMHIMRCVSTSKFEGGPTEHFSIRTLLGHPQAGTDKVRHLFYFVCKNSCVTGMNRRPIEVIFTLEDETGKVYGRRKLNVRICSCPKRDMEKAEDEFYKNQNGCVPKSKKRKVMNKKPLSFSDPNDTEKYNVTFDIIGKANVKAVMKYAQLLMADDMHRATNKQPYEACYNELDNMINSN